MFSQKMFSPENVLHKFLERPWSGERNGKADPNSRSVGATREWRSVASQYFSTNIDFRPFSFNPHTFGRSNPIVMDRIDKRICTFLKRNVDNDIEALIYCWYILWNALASWVISNAFKVTHRFSWSRFNAATSTGDELNHHSPPTNVFSLSLKSGIYKVLHKLLNEAGEAILLICLSQCVF